MNLDPVSLRLFVLVAETGAIAKAAARLNIVTSAASKRLVVLEERLQTQLLRRTNHGVELTAAGLALERLARRVVAELDDIAPQIRDYSKGIRGHIRVLANASAICQFLPADLAEFLHQNPQVYVHFEEQESESILKAVSENVADLGISFAGRQDHGLQEAAYHRYRLVALLPTGHALAARRSVGFLDTLEFPHVGLWAGSAANQYMNLRAAELGRSIDYRMYVDSYHAMAQLVRSGLGVGIVPQGLLRTLSRGLGLKAVALDDDWAERRLSIYFPAYERLQAAPRLLVDHLRASS